MDNGTSNRTDAQTQKYNNIIIWKDMYCLLLFKYFAKKYNVQCF